MAKGPTEIVVTGTSDTVVLDLAIALPDGTAPLRLTFSHDDAFALARDITVALYTGAQLKAGLQIRPASRTTRAQGALMEVALTIGGDGSDERILAKVAMDHVAAVCLVDTVGRLLDEAFGPDSSDPGKETR